MSTQKTPANRTCYSSFFSTILSVKILPTPVLIALIAAFHTTPTLAEVLRFTNGAGSQSNLSAGVLKFDTNGVFIPDETHPVNPETNNTATRSAPKFNPYTINLDVNGEVLSKLNLLRLKSKGSVVLSAFGAKFYSFPTEVGGFKPICGK